MDPRWNEIFYAALFTKREKIFLEVLDWNNLQKDKKLGHIEFPVSSILPDSEEKVTDAVNKLIADGFKIEKKHSDSADV